MKQPKKLTRKKAMKAAQDTVAVIGLNCYKKGMDDAMDIMKAAFQTLEGQGMKEIKMEEAIVLVAQVRSINDQASGLAPEPSCDPSCGDTACPECPIDPATNPIPTN